MVTNATTFSSILKLVPRDSFNSITTSHFANKWRKTYSCWDHLVTMIYQQLTHKQSLRTLEAGFNSHLNSHYHLGIQKPIKKSTIADANNSISPNVFLDLLNVLITTVKGSAKKELNQMIRIIDSTPIQLRGNQFAWAKSNYRIKGLKVHTVYVPNQQIGTHFVLSDANINDITPAKQFSLEKGATYIFDKAYCSLEWWNQLAQNNCRYVTRLKKNTRYEVREKKVLSTVSEEIMSDEVIVLSSSKGKKLSHPLRKIVVMRGEGKKPVSIISNDLESAATELAGLYKRRWEIEVFFKWLKQNLKIKRYLGQSKVGIKNQLLIALITYVLVYRFKKMNRFEGSQVLLFVIIKENLFGRRALRDYLKAPPDKSSSMEFKQMDLWR